jgi:hypothetical protein
VGSPTVVIPNHTGSPGTARRISCVHHSLVYHARMTWQDALALLPAEVPLAFSRLLAEERAWRGPLFLMTWILSGHVAYSWWAALSEEPWFVRSMQQAVAETPDERLIEAFHVAWDERRRW